MNQTVELREDFRDPILGTCEESITGGNHFRYAANPYLASVTSHMSHSVFQQNGPNANSGAMFLAVSQEEVRITYVHDTCVI